MITFPDTDALSNAALIAAEIVRTGGSFVVSETESPQGITEPSQSLVSEAEDEQQQQQQQVEEQSHPTQGRISPSSYDEDDDEDGGSGSESDEDQGRRVAKSRERNREHARRTRLRKKAQLEALQSRIKGLRAEAEVLKQSLEECSLASILMGLSSHKRQEQDLITDSLLSVATTASSSVACTKDADEIVELVGGKRRRFTSPDAEENKSVSTQPLKLRINGKVTYIGGGRSHINWKTGVYNDDAGTQKQLTQSQLESLRYVRRISSRTRLWEHFCSLGCVKFTYILAYPHVRTCVCRADVNGIGCMLK